MRRARAHITISTVDFELIFYHFILFLSKTHFPNFPFTITLSILLYWNVEFFHYLFALSPPHTFRSGNSNLMSIKFVMTWNAGLIFSLCVSFTELYNELSSHPRTRKRKPFEFVRRKAHEILLRNGEERPNTIRTSHGFTQINLALKLWSLDMHSNVPIENCRCAETMELLSFYLRHVTISNYTYTKSKNLISIFKSHCTISFV